jgi:pectate lyase
MRHAKIWAAVGSGVLAVVVGFAATASAATLFSDDFNDGNASGWTTSGGSWSVASGAYTQSGTSADAKSQAGNLAWTNVTMQARVRVNTFGSNSSRAAGITARAQSSANSYALALTPSTVELRRGSNLLASAAFSVSVGTWYTLRLEAFGSSLRGFVNGAQLLSISDSNFATGRVGFIAKYAAASFDDVVVTDTAGPGPTPTATSSSPGPSPSTSPTPQPPAGQADGFATGTTGGAGGPTVTATTGAQLQTYVGQAGPLVIMVQGTITLSGMITVIADKSIIGVGSTAHITGGGLQTGSTTRPGNNVIIRNIKFSNAGDDSISVTNNAHHVWIDHNEFLPAFDGSVDIKHQSTNVTVSWNKFSGTDKTMLLGHSDSATEDVGYLKVSYHHNWFEGAIQRLPRVRFGEPVHVYNNYYRNIGLYGVASTMNAGVVVEGNYFENVAFPCYSVSGYADSDPGRLVQRNNIFNGSGVCEAGGSVTEPSGYYGYTLTPAASVPSAVTASAGVGHL